MTTMTRNTTRYTFDTVFSNGRGGNTDTPARRRTTYTEADIEAARAQAHAEGMRAGEVRALESLAAGAQETANAMRAAVDTTKAQLELLRSEAAAIALVLARKLAGAAVSALPAGEVEAALRQAMHQALGEPRIVLHARPEVVEALQGRIPEIAHEEGYDGRIQVAADASLRGADCRIEWRGGGAERAGEAIDASLAAIMARRFQGASGRIEE
jgi:flagellar assembly protein FliH